VHWLGKKAGVGWLSWEGAFFCLDFLGTFCVKTKSTKEIKSSHLQLQRLILKLFQSPVIILFCLDTKKNEKKSSTNTAPLPSASRIAITPSRVGRAVRAHLPPCGANYCDFSLLQF